MSDEKVTALLVHVGADTSNLGYVGPLFDDGTFEYLPMLETYLPTKLNKKYSELSARQDHFKYGKTLADFVLERDREERVHYDPHFGEHGDLYTYAENYVETEGRLLNLEVDDLIFFYCSLVPYSAHYYSAQVLKSTKSLIEYQRNRKNKYVIGFFTVAGISDVTVKLRPIDIEITPKVGAKLQGDQVKKNQHYLEAIADKTFRVVRGDPDRSALLRKAVSLTARWDQKHNQFKLKGLGKDILQSDSWYDAMRNVKKLKKKGERKLVDAILKTNPDLKGKFTEHIK